MLPSTSDIDQGLLIYFAYTATPPTPRIPSFLDKWDEESTHWVQAWCRLPLQYYLNIFSQPINLLKFAGIAAGLAGSGCAANLWRQADAAPESHPAGPFSVQKEPTAQRKEWTPLHPNFPPSFGFRISTITVKVMVGSFVPKSLVPQQDLQSEKFIVSWLYIFPYWSLSSLNFISSDINILNEKYL